MPDRIRARLDDRWHRPKAARGGDESDEWRWQVTMVEALLIQLKELAVDRDSWRAIESNRSEFDALFERYKWLESVVRIEAELEERDFAATKEAAQDLVRFLRDDVRALLRDTLTLVASIVLVLYRTERRRQSALAELGFVF